MLFVVSPAKALDYDSPVAADIADVYTQPALMQRSMQLIEVLRAYSPQQVADLMRLSDRLATLNVARYAAFEPECTVENAKQAVLAFNGDVYTGLAAADMDGAQLQWLQRHARILSGLYGVLRPLDLMQPYRLEMGTRLKTDAGKDLYAFWGDEIARQLNAAQAADGAEPVLVNLASQEYFRSVDRKALKARVLDVRFEDYRSGQYKVISFYAKRARGMMLRYAVQHQCTTVEQLKGFDSAGYGFDAQASDTEQLVFRRVQQQAA